MKNLAELIEMVETAKRTDTNDFLRHGGFDAYTEAMEFLEKNSEEAMRIILSKISEKDFVRLMGVVKSFTLSAMLSHGEGPNILMAQMNGRELDGFTHTIVLSVIGLLISEEIL